MAEVMFNREASLELLGNDESLLRELAKVFLANCPSTLERLAAAAARRDRDALFSAAHSLKGAAAPFAAEIPVAAALRVERACRAGDVDGALAGVAELHEAVMGLAAALQADGLGEG